MEKEEIKRIRDHCKIARDMKDEEINRLDAYLRDTKYLRRDSEIQVANLIELRNLRHTHFKSKPEPFSDPYGQNVFWLFCCESLFVEGHYGPCCAWARATVEYILYELCQFDPRVPNEFKEEIFQCGENPGIDSCLRKLREVGSISCEACTDCRTIAQNGDCVVHHRLGEILRGRGMRRLLRELGVKEKDLGKEGFKKHDKTRDDVIRKALRPGYERDMAKESMRLLYRFVSGVMAGNPS